MIFICPCWKYLFQTVFLECNTSHFFSQVCSCIFSVSSWPAFVRMLLFLHCIINSIFLALTVPAFRNYLMVGLILSTIKLKKCLTVFIEPKYVDCLRLMICAIVLFFDATYAIALFIDSFLCVKKMQQFSHRQE